MSFENCHFKKHISQTFYIALSKFDRVFFPPDLSRLGFFIETLYSVNT